MENKKYLTEENYEKGVKKVKKFAFVILIVGLLLGGFIIKIGLDKYGANQKEILLSELATEKENLTTKKAELEERIKPVEDEIKSLERVEFDGFDEAYYERKDKIEELEKSIEEDNENIKLIDEVIDYEVCNTSKAEYGTYTMKYCEIMNKISNIDRDAIVLYYMIGAFVIIASIMGFISIYSFSKGREIAAFATQQTMPIAKEGIDEMTPTIGNAAGEIAKGIKKGLKDSDKK